MRTLLLLPMTAGFWLLAPLPLRGGMPVPLPDNPELLWRLGENAHQRLQAISFFLAALLMSALLVRWLWNTVQRDFPRLPRLTYRRALAGVILWGLLFVIVLTMIGGARELMTPGAWKKQGFTYKLVPPPPEEEPLTLRRRNLEELRIALLHFAATHDGQFPAEGMQDELGPQLWQVPGGAGLRYLYLPGQKADSRASLLVCEPELDGLERFVLLTNGAIVRMQSAEIARLLKQEKQP